MLKLRVLVLLAMDENVSKLFYLTSGVSAGPSRS